MRSTRPWGAARDFDAAFPGETGRASLDALRELFRRKALLGPPGAACARRCWPAGRAPRRSSRCGCADLPDTEDAARAVALRAALGLPHDADAPALVAGDGAPLPLRRAAHVAAARRPGEPEPRGQRRHLPRPAAGALRSVEPRRRRSWSHDRGTPARLPRAAQDRRGRRAEDHRPAGRHRPHRRGGPVPHRPPHPGGAVGGDPEPDAALHPGARERRLGPRGRPGRDQRRGRRHGDRASR